ncbi:MAG TPA: Rieske (2Fe-2S) protein [Pilimelia sp.]|nr:Rieske (2Fe-2S) protein [Pilimelia sp.]
MSTEPAPCAAPCATRRAVLAAAGAVGAAGLTSALAGCQTYGNEAAAPPAVQPAPAPLRSSAKPGSAARTKPPATEEPEATEPPDAGPPPLAKVSEIPVGGGKIFTNQNVVLTQPQAGTIKAFSAACTHAGCPVTEVDGGTINCSCHGSRFKIADGSVAKGPAGQPLSAVRVKVQDGAIRLA